MTALPMTLMGNADQRRVAELLLRCILDGRAKDGALVELRMLHGDDRRQEWFDDARATVTYAWRWSPRWTVYVGCLPRFARAGGKAALRDGARMVWADCDSPAAVWALRRFSIRPSFAVYSGSGEGGVPHVHAWWLLRQRITLDAVEWINRRLAVALGSDTKVYDAPRVLRLPGTLNHKTSPPTPVMCAHVGDDVDVRELVAALPPLSVRAPSPPPRALRVVTELDTITPAEYVEHLTGRTVAASGKVKCPFHKDGDERTPSLHCWPDAARGWFCFGECCQGGDIYTFAGLLWGLEPRTQMVKVRARLEHAFGIEQPRLVG